jgi:SSS family solute:Na+ symporter
VIALVLFPGRESKTTFVTLLNELLPSGMRGLLLASLLAAMISSLLAVMNSISTLVVRDFVLHFRPRTGERAQVAIGRLAILIGAVMGIGAAYLVYKTPDGLYKYLQTISVYLVMPITPAIAFGIMSRRVTLTGAGVSVLVGIALASVFVADQLMGVQAGQQVFPWLHHKMTLIVTAALFITSAFTRKTDPERLKLTTVDWRAKREAFEGLRDWRLQWGALSLVTVGLYYWMY